MFMLDLIFLLLHIFSRIYLCSFFKRPVLFSHISTKFDVNIFKLRSVKSTESKKVYFYKKCNFCSSFHTLTTLLSDITFKIQADFSNFNWELALFYSKATCIITYNTIMDCNDISINFIWLWNRLSYVLVIFLLDKRI